MNTPGDHFAPLPHPNTAQLLRRLPTGTLDDTELAQVQCHVQACAQCQAELELQRGLHAAATAQLDCAFDVNRAYAKLLPRLGPQAPRLGIALPGRWRAAGAANSPWLRWSVLAAIGILGLMLARPGHDAAGYQTSGDAAHAKGQLVVIFKPATTEREMRRILRANGAHVVDGPTLSAAYILALPASQAGAALARMRTEPAVTLVQPLASASPP